MPRKRTYDLGVDANGRPTELRYVGGQPVIIHYDDLPDSDITTVDGLRCTTPLRTVIDMAPDLSHAELVQMVRECLGRGLFTIDDAMARLAQPDMTLRPGAHVLSRLLRA